MENTYKAMEYKNLITEFEVFLAENNFDLTDISVNCNTNEKAEIYICILDIMGASWNVDRPLLINGTPVTKWEKNKEDTCYRVKDNDFVVNARKEYYENNNIPVIAFEDIFKSIIDELTEIPELSEQNNKKKKGLFSYAKKKKAITENTPREIVKKEITSDNNLEQRSDLPADENLSDVDNTEDAESITDDIDNSEEINESDKTDVYVDNDETVEPVESAESQVENDYYEDMPVEEDVEIDEKAEEEKVFFLINKPFIVGSLDNRIFRITEQYLRQENINGYWIPCNNEWELSYILYLYATKSSELQFLGGDTLE